LLFQKCGFKNDKFICKKQGINSVPCGVVFELLPLVGCVVPFVVPFDKPVSVVGFDVVVVVVDVGIGVVIVVVVVGDVVVVVVVVLLTDANIPSTISCFKQIDTLSLAIIVLAGHLFLNVFNTLNRYFHYKHLTSC